MNSYIYVVDFGEVVKIGYSANPENRIKTLSSQFKLKPLRELVFEVKDAYSVECRAKKELSNLLKPFGGISTETFDCSFSRAVKSVCDADDYFRLKRNDDRYSQYVYEARLTEEVMEMIYSCRDRDRFIEEAVKEKFSRDGIRINWERPRSSVFEILINEDTQRYFSMTSSKDRGSMGRIIDDIVKKRLDKISFNGEG